MTHTQEKKEQTILFAFEGSSDVGFKRQKLPSKYYKYIQNIRKTMFEEFKKRYKDNVSSNRK